MTTTIYPRDQVEDLVAWAKRSSTLHEAMSQTTAIMRAAFPEFDHKNLGLPSRGASLNAELLRRGLPPLPKEALLWIDGPIICHNAGGWGPEWEGHPVRRETTKTQIRLERIETVLGYSPFRVGPTEFGCVAYAASAAAPMREPLHELYIWACSKWLDRVLGAEPGMTYEKLGRIGSHPGLTDEDVLHREPYRSTYTAIADDIRRKVTDEARLRERDQRPGKDAGGSNNAMQF